MFKKESFDLRVRDTLALRYSFPDCRHFVLEPHDKSLHLFFETQDIFHSPIMNVHCLDTASSRFIGQPSWWVIVFIQI